MKPYRPPDWDKINPKPMGQSMGYGFTREDMYKRGEDCADAMLRALRDGAYRIEAYGYVDFPILASKLKCGSSSGRAGYIVFIPEEE